MIDDLVFPRFRDDVVLPKGFKRKKLRIRLPKQKEVPEPPDQDCALCRMTRPWHWFLGHKAIPVCHGCTYSSPALTRHMDFRDAMVIDQAMAVIKRLETKYGP